MGAVYESFLLFGPLLVIAFIFSVLTNYNDQADPTLENIKRQGLQLFLIAAVLAYFTWGWSKGRCTLPMQTLGLSVQMTDGRPLTVGRALLRAIVAAPSMLTGIGLLWAVFDRDSQTLHDRLTATRLTYTPVNRML